LAHEMGRSFSLEHQRERKIIREAKNRAEYEAYHYNSPALSVFLSGELTNIPV
jgi:hypothetical protein